MQVLVRTSGNNLQEPLDPKGSSDQGFVKTKPQKGTQIINPKP